MLVQSESEKLKERELKHNAELQEWRDSLAPKKRVSHPRLLPHSQSDMVIFGSENYMPFMYLELLIQAISILEDFLDFALSSVCYFSI